VAPRSRVVKFLANWKKALTVGDLFERNSPRSMPRKTIQDGQRQQDDEPKCLTYHIELQQFRPQDGTGDNTELLKQIRSSRPSKTPKMTNSALSGFSAPSKHQLAKARSRLLDQAIANFRGGATRRLGSLSERRPSGI